MRVVGDLKVVVDDDGRVKKAIVVPAPICGFTGISLRLYLLRKFDLAGTVEDSKAREDLSSDLDRTDSLRPGSDDRGSQPGDGPASRSLR